MASETTARFGELLHSPRYEILPTASIVDKVAAHIDPGRTLTITASASLGLEATLGVAEDLQKAGWQAVPHLAARMISGRSQLQETVQRLSEAGITEVFIPGGDADPPAGDYAQALDLLRDLRDLGDPFARVGIAGYPESHPVISDADLEQALEAKSSYASHLVSNLCFDHRTIGRWVAELRGRGVVLPLMLGIPGKVKLTKLASVAAAIGVGESAKFLTRNTATFARLARPDGYRPHALVTRVLREVPEVMGGIAGLHIYTFNQVEQTEQWRREQLSRLR